MYIWNRKKEVGGTDPGGFFGDDLLQVPINWLIDPATPLSLTLDFLGGLLQTEVAQPGRLGSTEPSETPNRILKEK